MKTKSSAKDYKPFWHRIDRKRFILTNHHVAPQLYSGWFFMVYIWCNFARSSRTHNNSGNIFTSTRVRNNHGRLAQSSLLEGTYTLSHITWPCITQIYDQHAAYRFLRVHSYSKMPLMIHKQEQNLVFSAQTSFSQSLFDRNWLKYLRNWLNVKATHKSDAFTKRKCW